MSPRSSGAGSTDRYVWPCRKPSARYSYWCQALRRSPVPGRDALGDPEGRRDAGAEREPEGDPRPGAVRGLMAPAPSAASSALAASRDGGRVGVPGLHPQGLRRLAERGRVVAHRVGGPGEERVVLDERRAVLDPAEVWRRPRSPRRRRRSTRAPRGGPGTSPSRIPASRAAPPARTARIAARGSRKRALTKKSRIEAAQAADDRRRAPRPRAGTRTASRAAPGDAEHEERPPADRDSTAARASAPCGRRRSCCCTAPSCSGARRPCAPRGAAQRAGWYETSPRNRAPPVRVHRGDVLRAAPGLPVEEVDRLRPGRDSPARAPGERLTCWV